MSTITDSVVSGGIAPREETVFTSDEIDFTQTGVTVVVPGRAGRRFIAYRYLVTNTQTSGVYSTAGTFKVGSVTNDNNMIAATAGVLVSGSFGGGVGAFYGAAVSSTAAGEAIVAGDPLVLTMTVGAAGTGGFAWRGKFVLYGSFV